MEPETLELRLLLACARVVTEQEDDAAVRQMLAEDIDWTLFARKAIGHGLAGLAGHNLAHVAPDLVPADILDAFRVSLEQTRRANRALFDELARLIEGLANERIEAIPLKGPILAIQAYGDLGLRVFRDLDFLVRDSDMAPAIATLHDLGYARQGQLTETQFELIHRLQGQEIIFKKFGGTAVEPHTRLTSIKMALDIDYDGLWRRARRTDLLGHNMLTLAPEDELVILAVHGGKEMWWNIKWACDVAAFISSRPKLDWAIVTERARAQGCLRMLLLATSLARRYFRANVPNKIVAAEDADPAIKAMVGRIMALWQADELVGPPDNRTLSMDRLRLHDGFSRRVSYMARTLLLPAPQHVAMMPLPRALSFAYVPLKLAHDLIALPLWRGYQKAVSRTARLKNAVSGSDLARVVLPNANTERYEQARDSAKRALAADPNNGKAWRNLAHALFSLKRYKEAIECYDTAIGYEPDNRVFWKNRTAALEAIGKNADDLDLSSAPKDSRGWTARAGAFWYFNRLSEAIEACDQALAVDPSNVAAARLGIHCRLHCSDWSRREDDKKRITTELKKGAFIVRAMDHRGLSDSEEELRLSAQFVAREIPPAANPLWHSERYRHDKIRLAYISADLRVHAVASVVVGCFEHHDKTHFETTAISTNVGDGSTMRRRIEAAFDRFIDAHAMNDLQVAKLMRELEIDIAIDLNGYSGLLRTGILAHRPTPVQVNYLGYSGTMDLPFIDYIIADRIIIPEQNRRFYREKVVELPHTYFPADRERPIAEHTPSRGEAGLPETGFVFACLNHTYKIGPEMFDVWMRLLRSVEGSVLWLRTTSVAAMSNLWREAKARGVAPERIVFAPPVQGAADHLARLRLADLFLDTLPYNAHATACDALWAGVPVLTCPGNTFPARVGASLLHALGLPELVTSSLADYEELALLLARNPRRLAAIRAKLMKNRGTTPLFDTARFTRDLESAYTTMWERRQAGLPPESFTVTN